MIPAELEKVCKDFWDANNSHYDLSHASGCGAYTEQFVLHAKHNGYPKVENLKKNPGQTQWNGHAVDAFLYAEPFSETNSLYQAVDIIASAESDEANFNWGVDTPRYTSADIWIGEVDVDDNVPWQPYDENSFQALKDMLAYDYGRRPQAADFDVTVWAARVFHSAYMGPDKTPLGLNAAILKHRPEWCEALGVPVDSHVAPSVVVTDDEKKG
jgi:hypothetical protein